MDKCSFCGKGERQVKVLVRGPGAAICNECVAFSYEDVLTAEQRTKGTGRSFGFAVGGTGERA